jgi:hypothetical protein
MELLYQDLAQGISFQNEILVNMPGIKGILKVALESGPSVVVKKPKLDDRKRKRNSSDAGVPFIKALPRNPQKLSKEMAGFINRLLEEHFFEKEQGSHVSMYL